MVPATDGTHTWEECERQGCEHKTELTNHVYDQQVVSQEYLVSEATCVETSKHYYSCVCGLKGSEVFESGEALGHQYGELVTKVEATCESKGMEAHYHCDECNTYFDEQKQETTKQALTLNKLEHDLKTYEEDGYTWQECEREGCDYQTTPIVTVIPGN